MDTVPQETILLWPEGAAGSEDWDQVEEELRVSGGLRIVRNVTQPSITVHPAEQPNGAAVIVAPGGAWHFLSIEHEGRQVARALNARGITAFVLKYRLIRTGEDIWGQVGAFVSSPEARQAGLRALAPLTLADAQQAVRVVRSRAAEWGVDPARVGFMGFSAGGGVTTQVVLNSPAEARPNFAAPIYGAVFDELVAPADAPPLFLLCAADDEMASRGSLIMYSAWKAAKRPVELHIYAGGGHGFGMNPQGLPCDSWLDRFIDWLRGIGVL